MIKTPPKEDAEKCLRLRKLSKQGILPYSTETANFFEKMFHDYPEWYTLTEEEVFNDTVPFGSYARYNPPRNQS